MLGGLAALQSKSHGDGALGEGVDVSRRGRGRRDGRHGGGLERMQLGGRCGGDMQEWFVAPDMGERVY